MKEIMVIYKHRQRTQLKQILNRISNIIQNPSEESWKIKTKPRKGSGSAPSNKFFPRCEIWEWKGEKQHES